MPAVFVDTAVIMYAAGRDHPLRAPCVAVIERIASGSLEAMISVEVIQEIIHRYSSVGRADRGRGIAMDALDLFAPVLPVTHDVVRRAVDMVEQYQTIRTRDLVHVATCLEEGIGVIVSPDEHFDGVREIRRVAPGDAEALAR